LLLGEGLRKVRNVTVFEFGYHRGSSGSGLFRRHPQRLSTLQTSVRGPSFPHPLSLRSYLPPAGGIVSWKYPSDHGCGHSVRGPEQSIPSIFHLVSAYRCRKCCRLAAKLRRTGRSCLGLMVACQGPRHLPHRPRWRLLVGRVRIPPTWGQGI
jgi:hypothetical protein